MAKPSNIPTVRLVGDVDHPDFRDAVDLLRAESRLVFDNKTFPELIVVTQSRPDAIGSDQFEQLQRNAPLAGIVVLLGSWCEGETRTGRPCPGIQRLYWYEFRAWWQRQLQLRNSNRCPDWSRPTIQVSRVGQPSIRRHRSSVVVLQTNRRDNADALADVLNQAGYSTAWQPPGHPRPQIRGAIAGVWDGGQLNDSEAADLASFCAQMSHNGAPVLAVLDFPRRDRVDRAYEIGAVAVVGKPWYSADLTTTLETITAASRRALTRAA